MNLQAAPFLITILDKASTQHCYVAAVGVTDSSLCLWVHTHNRPRTIPREPKVGRTDQGEAWASCHARIRG